MSYTNSLDNPELYFQTKLYTGNATARAITLDGSENMQPDWIWFKQRSGTENHNLFDSVRGVGKQLESNATSAETATSLQTAFGTNGFSINDAAELNASGSTYVAWNWKAGTSFTNDASSTGIGTIDTAGSVSTDAGFSIITWTGNATSSQSVAHGLGAVPKVIFTKNTDNGSQPWKCYFEAVGNGDYLQLNATDTPATSGVWSSTTPTSSIISISNDTGINGSGNTILAYCFAEKKGYSKFGSYEGTNSSANGAFVYTGFKPAFMLVKNIDATKDWNIYDSARDIDNPLEKKLEPNTSDAESTDLAVDFLSNGFKFRQNGSNFNDANTYVYMSFAESPFVNSKGVPNNAR